jgi:hypothetical protein
MPRRPFVLALLCVVLIGQNALQATPRASQASSSSDHVKWVASVLGRMETIKPGMTRADLLKVFTTEGGLSTPLHRTFVSRDCPYFKVDVTFEAVGRPGRDGNGRVNPTEDGRDLIVKISQPYLGFEVLD